MIEDARPVTVACPSCGEPRDDRTCPNCESPHAEKYCPACGQRQGPTVVSIGRLAHDILEDQFSLDSSLPRTLRALFFRPGHLTLEYVSGRARRYVAPFRLYLAFSVVFFLAVALTGGRGVVTLTSSDEADPAASSAAAPAPEPPPVASDPAQERDRVQVELGNQRLNEAVAERLRQIIAENPDDARRVIADAFVQRASTALFFLLPVYAVLLKLLYTRQRRLYAEHFVFSLHHHAFALGTGIVVAFLRPAAPVMALWLLVYTYLAMRRFYGQSRLITGVKTAVLSLSYMVVLGVWLAFTLAFAVLLA